MAVFYLTKIFCCCIMLWGYCLHPHPSVDRMVSSSSKWIFLKFKVFLDNCIWLHFFTAWFLNKNKSPLSPHSTPTLLGLWDYGVLRHFQQYFSCIVVVSFIGGGNQSTWRKPPTCRKSLTNFITYVVPRVHLAMNEVRTHNDSDDGHWLHRKL